MPAAEMPYPAVATPGHMMPYGFLNVPMSPYLWPLMMPYSPLSAPGQAFCAANTGNVEYQRQLQLQIHHMHRQQHERFRQLQFSPDRASVDAAGQTPEMARLGKCVFCWRSVRIYKIYYNVPHSFNIRMYYTIKMIPQCTILFKLSIILLYIGIVIKIYRPINSIII
jgi:hypothetical protein